MAKIQTRARAIDMLGRQQIAGIQNALSELFKNAHDAYADHISVDFFEDFGGNDQELLMVRDDGVGMTLEDFKDKWLVLGTESKITNSDSKYRPLGKDDRPITGEKGIGRLAIALLGRQTLILTKALRAEGTHDMVVALVHWGLFEIPGVNLEEIDISILTVPDGQLPSADVLTSLRLQLVECVRRIEASHSEISTTVILNEIDEFQPELGTIYSYLEAREDAHLNLNRGNSGTHFLIAPSNPIIKVELEAEARSGDYNFRKQLLGFADSVFQEEQTPKISTSFTRWRPGDLMGNQLLDSATFFTRDELLNQTDHLLNGNVDEFGQFTGSLRVYDQIYDPLVVPWNANKGRKTNCGPFSIIFGYVMGRSAESKLAADRFAALNIKLNHVGGIYIYRDGIRILPYGDYSFDWLEIEKRRNKGAGYYFFSFRRMFGAVLLTRATNASLQEKAGREGFQQNVAYRELREILINLLLYLAAEFFRKDGANTELFEHTQEEIRKRSKALQRQQKQANTKRRNFASALAGFASDLETNLPHTEVSNLRRVTRSRMDAASNIKDPERAAAELIRVEDEAISNLAKLREKYTRKRPMAVAFGKELQRDWEAYVLERAELENSVFAPFEIEIGKTLGDVAEQARVYIDQRKRLENRIKKNADERRKELAAVAQQANVTASDTRDTVFKITERARLALDGTIRSIEADLNRTDLHVLDPEQVDEMRSRWEEQLVEVETRHHDALLAARDMLASLAENLRISDGEEPAQVLQAMEERMLALEEQADEDFEMVQLGIAVAIINHEFAASIKHVRKSVRELGHVSRRSEALKPLYESIRSNFEHLDGHLNLFTPLQRRLHRATQIISGRSIRNYCTDLFSNRLERHSIKLVTSDRFLDSSVDCYPSTIYPTIINIVDNAIFWLSDISGDRQVTFDADDQGIYVSNNGPKIESRDYVRIFERGFSRKVGGRGLGLFISAKALEAEAMSLMVLDVPRSDSSVTFMIRAKVIGKKK